MMPPVRRSLAVLIAALLAGLFAVAGISAPANAAPKASLKIVSVTNAEKTELGSLLVKNQRIAVEVTLVDSAGQPTTVSRATTIVLEEVSGPGDLTGTTQDLQAVIPRDGSGATISGDTGPKYSQYANDVVLRVRVKSGVDLLPAAVSVDFALTAVSDDATPGAALDLKDQNCGAPTLVNPTCGRLLLPNGANSDDLVIMSVGSCDGLVVDDPTDPDDPTGCKTAGAVEALVITAVANLKGADGKSLYRNTSPATLIIACDKALCRETANGVPKIPVIYTVDNTGPLDKVAQPCPAKGVIGEDQDGVCVDYVSSSRSQGDLYLYLLFNIDMRGSL